MRRMHSSRRKRDRDQWAQCSNGSAEGPQSNLTRLIPRPNLAFLPALRLLCSAVHACTSCTERGIRFRDLVPLYVVIVLSVRWTATAASAGPSILVIWFAALTCFFIPLAACVMELSSRTPREGGIYIWTREAFGDFSGFICAWTYWMSNLPYFPALLYFGAGSVLFAFGPRAQMLNANPLYYMAFATIALAIIALLNIVSVNAGKWLNNFGALTRRFSLHCC